jgi:hypothetical protein
MITKKLGRKLLNAIISDESYDYRFQHAGITREQFSKVKIAYLTEKKQIEKELIKSYAKTFQQAHKLVAGAFRDVPEHVVNLIVSFLPNSQPHKTPRYLPFYNVIKKKYPLTLETSDDKTAIIRVTTPTAQGKNASICRLLFEEIRVDHNYRFFRGAAHVMDAEILSKLEGLFLAIEVIKPDLSAALEIASWIKKGLSGERLTLFCPVCPDYSVTPTGNPLKPYRHTFESVDEKIGIVARRTIDALPQVIEFLNSINVKVDIYVALADFEAYSEPNLSKFKLTSKEFLAKIESSRKLIEETLKKLAHEHLLVLMITDFCQNYASWLAFYNYYFENFKRYEFSGAKLSNQYLLNIVTARKEIYDRWFGKKDKAEDYLSYVFAQGAEYAAIGASIKNLKNVLILGSDNPLMGAFYDAAQPYSKAYLKRYYC